MSAAPKLKVYSQTGEYVAACKYAEDAAAIVSLYGAGATIRSGHTKADVVWTEGSDGEASESYDVVADTIRDRIAERRAARERKERECGARKIGGAP